LQVAQIKNKPQREAESKRIEVRSKKGIGGFGAKNLRLNPLYPCSFSAFCGEPNCRLLL